MNKETEIFNEGERRFLSEDKRDGSNVRWYVTASSFSEEELYAAELDAEFHFSSEHYNEGGVTASSVYEFFRNGPRRSSWADVQKELDKLEILIDQLASYADALSNANTAVLASVNKEEK